MLARTFVRFGNAATKLLLRSPLHRFLSGRFMVISVTGAKSGRRYSTPVNYVQNDGVLIVMSRTYRTWWRNVRGGAPVRVRLRGRERAGAARVVGVGAETAPAVRDYYKGLLGRELSQEQAERQAGDKVIVEVRLDDAA